MTSTKYPTPKSLAILKVSQLRDIIRDNNIVLPTEGTGKNKNIIKPDLIKAIKDFRSKKDVVSPKAKKTSPKPKSASSKAKKTSPKAKSASSKPKKTSPKPKKTSPKPKKTSPKSKEITKKRETQLVEFLTTYQVKNGKLDYDLVDLVEYAREINQSKDNTVDKTKEMGYIFDDFRYQNDRYIAEQVDTIFENIPHKDLITALNEAYKLYRSNKYLPDKINKLLKTVFSDLRFLNNEQTKYDVVKWLLNKTPENEEYGAFDFLTYGFVSMRIESNILKNYNYFNSRIPLKGEYIFQNDSDIIELAFQNEQNVLLSLMVAANIDELQKQDKHMLNRLTKHLDETLDYKKKYELWNKLDQYSIIVKASDVGFFQAIDRKADINQKIRKKLDIWGSSTIEDEIKGFFKTEKGRQDYIKRVEELRKKYDVKYDLKTGNIKAFLEKDAQRKSTNYYATGKILPRYPYVIYYYYQPKDLNFEVSGHGFAMYFPNEKDRRKLLNQLIDYYVKIYDIDYKEALEMLIDDIERFKEGLSEKIGYPSRIYVSQIGGKSVPNSHKKEKEIKDKALAEFNKINQETLKHITNDLGYIKQRLEDIEAFKPEGSGFFKLQAKNIGKLGMKK